MSSAYEIKVDFQNAREQAQRLDDLAGRIDSEIAGRMTESNEQLHAAWTGENATRYLRDLDNIGDSWAGVARSLRIMADMIRLLAQQIYDAEMEALRIAQTRSSGDGGGGGSW